MFEELISALQGMDVGFEEMPEEGMISINVNELDKAQLIEVLNMIYNAGMTVSELTETSMTIAGVQETTEDIAELSPVTEDDTAEDADQMAALDEALSGM
jgi:hypothetical protein